MLADAACRQAICPDGKKRVRLTDAEGLYLEISASGTKRWFWKFYPDGKESRLALGSYPKVSLAEARRERNKARETRREGVNPVQRRKADRLANTQASATTFEAVALEFHESKAPTWSETHAAQWLRSMAKDVFPWVGNLPITDVSAPLLLETLRRVQRRGAVRFAHDLREFSGQVFRYGIATGRCTSNPAADLRGALDPFVERNVAAVLEPLKAGEMLRAIDGYHGQPTTRVALALSALLFQRPGNIRMMEWAEIDTKAALWTIPSAKMKRTVHGKINGRPHLVPLAPQALALLDEIRPLTGSGIYVFRAITSKLRPMSENTVSQALKRLGFGGDEMTPHGFRAMARTLMAERLPGIPHDVVEAQLAHGKGGPLGTAYDRAEYMEQRRRMMVEWANYLDRLRAGAEVVQLRGNAA